MEANVNTDADADAEACDRKVGIKYRCPQVGQVEISHCILLGLSTNVNNVGQWLVDESQ